METIMTLVFTSIFKAILYVFTMFGVTPKYKSYKPLSYIVFFIIVVFLNLILKLNVFWQCMLFYIFFMLSYQYIFDTSLYISAHGGLVVYILLSTNQMFLAMIAFIQRDMIMDYRDVFISLPLYLYIPSAVIAIIFVFLYNFCISYPQDQFKNRRHSWLDEGPQHVNILLSMSFLFLMSWNLKYFYSNSKNIGIVSGMSFKVFILLLLLFLAVLVIIYVVNRSFVQLSSDKNTRSKRFFNDKR